MTLNAVKHSNGWAVYDTEGGIWWPGEDAEIDINASDDPAAEAVRICETAPMEGMWRL